MAKKPKDTSAISAKSNGKMNNDHVARLRVVQEVSSRNSSASWNSSCTFSTEQSFQDQPRPPVYNVEDYAGALRKFGKRGQAPADDDPSAEPKHTEMTLKEFTSATELLDKLKADLKLAYFSFVQEFVGDPVDGVTLLLELLKTIQQSGSQTKCTAANQRRVALDENSCLQCLKYCLRCQDAARKLAISPAGLYTLAACIMSTVNQSRLLTLELLTKACCESGTADGHNTVSDAMSTMRLRFAEPVRFRFLVGMLSGSGSSGMELLLGGLRFVNAFTETCPDLQTKFYVQAELKQAGFKPAAILKNISNKSPLLSSVSDEIYRWQKNFINVESLKRQHDEVVREAKTLREKVAVLEKKIHMLQEEKRAKDRGGDGTGNGTGAGNDNKNEGGGNSAEDEGISSSEQDDCEDELSSSKKADKATASPPQPPAVAPLPYGGIAYGSASRDDTTVDAVLEDFDKVINDASTGSGGMVVGRRVTVGPAMAASASASSSSVAGGSDRSKQRRRYYACSSDASCSDDAAIVPARIVPEPPRRSRSLFVNRNFEVNPFFEDDEDDDDVDGGGGDDDDDGDGGDEESAAESECAYDDGEGGGGDTSFRSVRKQIERFSALALRRDDRGSSNACDDRGSNVCDRDRGDRRDDDRDRDDGGRTGGRRKSIYDVFGGGPVARSASTRNACGRPDRRPVYLPTAAATGPADAFKAWGRGNAGLYSGMAGFNKSGSTGSLGGPSQCADVGPVTGKLTDFPSGLY